MTRKVASAASRSEALASAPESAPPKALSSARPATASTRIGEPATKWATPPASRPKTTQAAPLLTAAIQRRAGSGEASSPAHKAAMIELRLTEWPPNGAASRVKTPVVAINGPGAGR